MNSHKNIPMNILNIVVLGAALGLFSVYLPQNVGIIKSLFFSLFLIVVIYCSFNFNRLIFVSTGLLAFPIKIKLGNIYADSNTFILLLLFIISMILVLREREKAVNNKKIFIAPSIFLIFLWFSYIVNGYPIQGLWEMVLWTSGIMLFTSIQLSFFNTRKILVIIYILYFSITISSIIGIYLYINKNTSAITKIFPVAEMDVVNSTFWYYADLANAIGIIVVTVLSLIILDVVKNKKLKFLLLFLIVPNLIMLVISNSRGAWIGTAVSFVYLMIIMLRRKSLLSFIKYVLFILMIIIPFLLFNENFTARFNSIFTTSEGTNYLRVLIWQIARKLIDSHLLFGIGVGSFPYFLSFTEYSFSRLTVNFYHAHNFYLQMLLNGGLFVIVPFFIIILNIFKGFLSNKTSSLKIALISGLVVFFIQNVVDYVIWDPANMYIFWLFVGLIYKISSLDKEI